MNTPRYLVVAGNTDLTEDQTQALESLQTEVYHFELTTDSISYLIESGDGLILLPGWEDDPRAVLEVQVAKAFDLPVKTHLGWLQSLPTPPSQWGDFVPAGGWLPPDNRPNAHFLIEGNTIHNLISGEIIFDDPTITAEGFPHFADIVNLEEDFSGYSDRYPAPPCKHHWVITEEGVSGCENCGAAA